MTGLAEAWGRLKTTGHGMGDYVRLRLPGGVGMSDLCGPAHIQWLSGADT